MSAGQNRAIVDKLLTNVSNAYVPQGFISEQVLPGLSVVQQSGKLAGYGSAHLRIVNSIMAAKGKAPRVDSIVRSDSSYYIDDHGLESEVSAADYRNVEEPYDAEKDEVLGLTTLLYLGKEKALADALGSTSTMTLNTTLSGTAQFNQYSTSNPLGVFKDAFAAVKDGCGQAPNSAAMSWKVYNTLKYHPGILEALGFTANRAGLLTREDIARALDVKNLYIGEASYNSAADGQTASLAEVWGKNIIFYVRPDQVAKHQLSLGYYLTYQGEGARKVFKFPVYNPPESTGIIVKDSYDMLLANVNCGYLIKDAIA